MGHHDGGGLAAPAADPADAAGPADQASRVSQASPASQASQANQASPVSTAGPGTGRPSRPAAHRREGATPIWRRPWVRELLILALLLAAGVAATWPRASLITGRLQLSSDQSQDVWSLWWVAHQVIHLHNPWFTNYLAAPVGVQLGYDTLSPLLGLIMTPVTLAFGPGFSYNLLAIVAPGLAGYAMYRAARLWLRGLAGPIAAGAFFGLSAIVTSQDWSHMHTAMGCVFLPLALETSVRLRRRPTVGRGLLAGLVAGAALLVDQESAVLVGILVLLVLVPWLLHCLSDWRQQRDAGLQALKASAAGAVAAAVVAAPQLLAMAAAGGPGGPPKPPTSNYLLDAAELPSMFSPSPHLARYGMGSLASAYQAHTSTEMTATFGVVLTALALLGLVVSWRRSGALRLGLLWLGSALIALGPTLYVSGHQYIPLAHTWRGLRVSLLMPYTWLIRVPGLGSFREADRFMLLGLVGAALLAGAAVAWLRQHAWPAVIVVVILGALEAGWSGPAQLRTVPTSMPSLDRPIAADHSDSVVVDIPLVVRGPSRFGGAPASGYGLVLAAEDGHPRAMSYTAGVPKRTITGMEGHAFYADLVAVGAGRHLTPAQLAAARRDLSTLHVGWALVWLHHWAGPKRLATSVRYYANVERYLAETGFRFDYTADDVMVYRAAG